MLHKFCSSCGELKLKETEFAKNSSRSDGYAAQCKICHKEKYDHKRYSRNFRKKNNIKQKKKFHVYEKLPSDCEWRPVIIGGKMYEAYSISNDGRLVSHLKPTGGIKSEIDKSYNRLMKHSVSKNNSGRPRKVDYKISLPIDFFDGTSLKDFSFRKKTKNTIEYNVSAHNLVMNAFRPIDLNPPIALQEWETTPENAKQLIKDCIVINHIDHNPMNNNISNLEYVTPRQNANKAKIYYGGNVTNKNNITNNLNV